MAFRPKRTEGDDMGERPRNKPRGFMCQGSLGLLFLPALLSVAIAACSGSTPASPDAPNVAPTSANGAPTVPAAIAPADEPVSGAAAEHYARGHELLGQYNYPGAIRQFDEAIRLASDYVEAYLSRASANFQLGEEFSNEEAYLKVVEDTGVVIRLDPDNSQAFLLRGDARSVLGQLEGAIEDYTAVIRLKPQSSIAYQNRSSIHRSLCHAAEAREDAAKAVETAPGLFDLIAFTEAELARNC